MIYKLPTCNVYEKDADLAEIFEFTKAQLANRQADQNSTGAYICYALMDLEALNVIQLAECRRAQIIVRACLSNFLTMGSYLRQIDLIALKHFRDDKKNSTTIFKDNMYETRQAFLDMLIERFKP